MNIESNIRDLLASGYSPQDVIREGYTKSTVYKVYRNLAAQRVPIMLPAWQSSVETRKDRYLPGETAVISYSVRNTSGIDLYIYRIGIQPEWLQGEWYARESRSLLRPGESQSVVLNVPIVADIALGEYEMRCGLDAQFVGPGAPPSIPAIHTQWTEPFILEIKKPLRGYKVFISHSTADMYLVRQLQDSIDNEGIVGVVAEDAREPSAVLREKFETMIRESHFFLALLTANGVRSKWVIDETNYALSIGKPAILLKEKEIHIESDIEWVEFSRHDSPETVVAKAQESLDSVKQKHHGVVPLPNLVPVIAISALAFLVGVAAGKSGSS